MNEATTKVANNRRQLTVLIADDEPDTVMTLGALLEDEGHVVQTVRDGALVLDAVEQFKPEVCIFDIALPTISGYTLAYTLSAAEKSDRPLLIAISGKWKTSPDRNVAKKAGFDLFFEKPADPADVINALDQLRVDAPAGNRG